MNEIKLIILHANYYTADWHECTVGCPIFGLLLIYGFFFHRGVFFFEKRRGAIYFTKKRSLGVPVGKKPWKSAKNCVFLYKKIKKKYLGFILH